MKHLAASAVRRSAFRWLSSATVRTSAFTLLEILIALGLSVVLLFTVYQAVDLHWKYSLAGRYEVERAQIARALLGQIANDIRSVVFRPSDSVSTPETDAANSQTGTQTDSGTTANSGATTGSSAAAASGTTANSQTDIVNVEMTDGTNASTAGSSGVSGDSTTLDLHISRPQRDLGNSAAAALSSDLQSVSYFLAGGSVSGTDAFLADTSGTASGLARTQGGRFELSLADEEGDAATLEANTQVLAPEVSLLQFRYFDGVEWLEEWDSVENNAVPAAIEIVIGFQAPINTGNSLTNRPVSSSTDTYRLVVALPLAKPVAVESGL